MNADRGPSIEAPNGQRKSLSRGRGLVSVACEWFVSITSQGNAMSGPVMRAVRTEASRRPLQVPADSGDVRLSDIFDLTWSASLFTTVVSSLGWWSAVRRTLAMLGQM
jgi:hypothetical protein